MLATTRQDDIETKLQRYENICGIINRTLGNKIRRDTRLKLCKKIAIPILMYDSEI
jgi:hypothetical protein